MFWNLQRFAGEGPAGEPAAAETAAAGKDPAEETRQQETPLPEEQEGTAAPHPESETADSDPDTAGKEPAPEEQESAAPAENEAEARHAAPADQAPSIEERLAALEEALRRQSNLLAQREQEAALRQHFIALEKQGEALKESFPGFDLRAELNDPLFVRLTSPMVGLSVEDAYYAIHHREITEAGAQEAAEKLGNSLQAGRAMPFENGTVARESPQGGFRPLAELSPEERKMRMDLIRSGKLRFD